jgi:exopolysaccharide biosynthesis polyprenyl glycosylphosphotransferase
MQMRGADARRATRAPAGWATAYARRLIATDLLAIVFVVVASQLVWFGISERSEGVGLSPSSELRGLAIGYSAVSVILILLWMAALQLAATRSARVVGIGIPEYTRIVDASIRLFGIVAIAGFLLKVDLARGYILTAFPAGIALLLITRWLWRKWLVRKRRDGRMSARTVVVGSPSSIRHIWTQFSERFPLAGYELVGVCLTDTAPARDELVGFPVLGYVRDLPQIVVDSSVDVVIVTSTSELTPEQIKNISWSLEDSNVDIALSPSLLDVVGPRVHTRSVAGMPLIHIDSPQYEGSRAAIKAVFDRTASLFAVIVFSPLLLVLAIGVRMSGPGPVFFRQVRIGRNGVAFRMLKFRSMVNDAEKQLELLSEFNDSSGGILFKMREDPRVTPIGRVMRRHSLDELPQFFNVLRGDMSLVGPRPPLISEVEKYESHVLRRFLVKPGLTGPWQISGRADLSWDDSIRLDLYYVENWSLTGDLIYLWRTAKVVVGGRGAY